MTSASRKLLDQFIKESVSTFFKGSEVGVIGKDQFEQGSVYNCILSFCHSEQNGSFILSCPESLISQSIVIPVPPTEQEAYYVDWLGEAGNRIVSLFKSRLIPYGLRFKISPPSVTVDERQLDDPEFSNQYSYYFAVKGSVIGITLDVDYNLDIDPDAFVSPARLSG